MHLEFIDVCKDFSVKRGAVTALQGINMHVETGEFVCVVGASGSGKSTLLRLVAGLDTPTSGMITVDGDRIVGPGPDRGMVFQRYTLYPWMTVERNVEFGLKLQGLNRSQRHERAKEYLEIVGLSGCASSLPYKLSGGMKQRVAIARALVCQPKILLMDEPFGALDVQTKERMQDFLLNIWRKTGTSILMITHDVSEAVYLSQRIYVLTCQPGRVMREVSINLDNDQRDYQIKTSAKFLDYQSEISDLIRSTMN
jgi:NitT/TauT family transport system ATP-binding protein